MNATDRPPGVGASIHRRLHAIRILPFVRGDLIVTILAAMIAAVAGSGWLEALRSSRDPQTIPLSRIFAGEPISNPHVETTGLLFPEAHLEYPHERVRGARPVEFSYVAMIDDAKPDRVLLVRFSGDLGHGAPRHATLSGLLEPPDAPLARQLRSIGGRLGGLPVEDRYVLVAGMRPKPAWLFGSVTLIAGASGLALLGAMIRGVFRERSPLTKREAP